MLSTRVVCRYSNSFRLDAAWQCPRESRLYHVRRTQISRDAEISLPQDLKIHCCRPAPVLSECEVGP